MRISVSCSSCSNEFSASENAAGKRVRCPACGEAVRVPLEADDEVAVPRSSSKSRKGKKGQAASSNSSALIGIAAGGGGMAVIGLLAVLLLNNRGGNPPAAPVNPGNMAATATSPMMTPAVPANAPEVATTAPPNRPATAAPVSPSLAAHSAAARQLLSPAQMPPTLQPATGGQANAALPASAPAGAPATAQPAIASVTSNKPATSDDDNAPLPLLAMPDLIAQVEKSVVRIIVKGEQGASVGSGFVVDTDGTIMTNYHVIEGAVSAQVEFENGEKYQVTGFTTVDKIRDLALIKIDADPAKLTRIRVAKKLPVKGTTVAAFGAPRGLAFTASDGIISAIRTTPEFDAREKGVYLQTTTPISPGNSGGPLVNMHGEVVGVNSFKIEGENLNFAVSSVDLQDVIEHRGATVTPLSPSALEPVFTKKNPFARAENIARTTKGNMLLGNINDAVIFILPFAVDPTMNITSFVDKQISKNLIGKAKWTEVTRGSQVKKSTAVVVAMIYFIADKKNPEAVELMCNLQIVARDVDKDGIDYIAIVYDENRTMGKISINSLAAGTIPNGMKKEIPEFFNKIVQDYRKAQRSNNGANP